MKDNRDLSQLTPGIAKRRVPFGPFLVDLHTHELWREGIRLKLAGQPFQVLAALLSRPGDLVTRDELQKQLWPEAIFGDSNHGLNAAVNKLREALNDTATEPKYIETLPRRGYRFIGTISPQQASVEPSHHEPEIGPTRANEEDHPPANSAFPNLSAHRLDLHPVGIAVALFAILFAGLFFANRRENSSEVPLRNSAMAKDAPGQPLHSPSPEQVDRPSVSTLRKEGPANPTTSKSISAHAGPFVTKPGVNAIPDADAVDPGNSHERPASDPALLRRVGAPEASPSLRTIISEAGNAAPQFSPDGTRIAFMSNRSGPWQIWVSNSDGSNPVQLSYTDSAGTPRWSPDGRYIAFDAPSDDGTSIFVAASDGRTPARRLVRGQVPSFSRDGKWVYFASDRSGSRQLWRIFLSTGIEQQVTQYGGFAAFESKDGFIYYSKSPERYPIICRISTVGGEEDCAFTHLRPRTWSSWAVTDNGLVFAEDTRDGHSGLSFYDPARRIVRDLISLQTAPVWMGVSADGRRAILNDAAERHISVVDNLH